VRNTSVENKIGSALDAKPSGAAAATPATDPTASTATGAAAKKKPPMAAAAGGGRKKQATRGETGGSHGSGGGAKVFKGTSVYRGVAQHRVTRRWESHVWENKKQIYLGSFATEEQAARAYDKAAIFLDKDTGSLNFSFSEYETEAPKIRKMTKEKLLAHLRRESNGFSRGKTRFRGVSYRAHTGRWEARISGIEEGKYTYLGTFDKPEEAAVAYDRAAIALKGKHAVTNYDIQDYEAELGHLTDMTPEELGKDSLTTRIAVQQNKEAYYKDIVAKGRKQGRAPASAMAIIEKLKAAFKAGSGGGKGKKNSGNKQKQTRVKEELRGDSHHGATSNKSAGGKQQQPGPAARKKKPTKRDRSINSDIRCQEAYAPIAKVVGRPHLSAHHQHHPHDQQQLMFSSPPPSDWASMCSPAAHFGPSHFSMGALFNPEEGSTSVYSDQTGTQGLAALEETKNVQHQHQHHQYGGLASAGPAPVISAGYPLDLPTGSYPAHFNILPGMVRPAHNMDVPITAYRSPLAAMEGRGQPTPPHGAHDDGLGGLLPPRDAPFEDLLRFPEDDKVRAALREEDAIFQGSRSLSQVNSTEENEGSDRGAAAAPADFQDNAKSEFDLYVEKLLDLDSTGDIPENDDDISTQSGGISAVPGAGGKSGPAKVHPNSSREYIAENLSAFLNNISLTDIPEIEEGDEHDLGNKTLLEIPSNFELDTTT